MMIGTLTPEHEEDYQFYPPEEILQLAPYSDYAKDLRIKEKHLARLFDTHYDIEAERRAEEQGYSKEWTWKLKLEIRLRDCHTCFICGHRGTNETLHVHHIDYNKKNCSQDNLITLCIGCHMQTNFKRTYWIKYFNDKRRG